MIRELLIATRNFIDKILGKTDPYQGYEFYNTVWRLTFANGTNSYGTPLSTVDNCYVADNVCRGPNQNGISIYTNDLGDS